ncbi:MAG TPA: 1,4-dihydroxy-2-naphthoate octaprenyltransferase [Bacteriovoracaceae bacterium]|nr:1,4-dihydroxy-2-naphthoate octaprenyltransferase [Bacteriovoracaceae bacterium]
MKNFILAARPKTLLAGVIPPMVAYSYYTSVHQESEVLYLALCVLGALLIQLATNFFNDVIDHEKGADAIRLGPTRVTASGLVDLQTVKRWAYACVVLAALCGIPLIFRGGIPFLVLGLVSLYLTFGYTGGKVSLAYRGLGELFVFLFFGLFSVMGSYYLFAQELNLGSLVLASIFGLLATTFICINNLRDKDQDAVVGKRTLATKLPTRSYQHLILLTIFFPYILLLFFRNYPLVSLCYLAAVPGLKLAQITLTKKNSELNEGLKFSGIHLVVFSLLLSFTFIYESLP